MNPSTLARSLLLGALGFSAHAAAACTRTITAKQGDTCATLASAAGITVTDFLRSNPGVTSCSQLVAGGSYCVAGTADSVPAAPTSTSAPPALTVSTDGTCGQGVTCSGSRFGNCCSAHGFCGSTDDYCGDGCQAGFGACGSGAGSSSPGVSVTVTVTTTSVVAITRTSVVLQTSTVTQTKTAGATATTTQTVITTRTTGITATATRTTTATVPTTATTTVRATSIVTLTTIQTSTRTVNVTSISIDTITRVVTSTKVIESGVCLVPTTVRPPIITVTQVQPGNPTATLPGTPSNCKHFASIRDGDTCRDLADRNGLTLRDFYLLNPSVSADHFDLICTPDFIEVALSGLCQINCDALWAGYFVCVGR